MELYFVKKKKKLRKQYKKKNCKSSTNLIWLLENCKKKKRISWK